MSPSHCDRLVCAYSHGRVGGRVLYPMPADSAYTLYGWVPQEQRFRVGVPELSRGGASAKPILEGWGSGEASGQFSQHDYNGEIKLKILTQEIDFKYIL